MTGRMLNGALVAASVVAAGCSANQSPSEADQRQQQVLSDPMGYKTHPEQGVGTGSLSKDLNDAISP